MWHKHVSLLRRLFTECVLQSTRKIINFQLFIKRNKYKLSVFKSLMDDTSQTLHEGCLDFHLSNKIIHKNVKRGSVT